jgi:hypothetical protein
MNSRRKKGPAPQPDHGYTIRHRERSRFWELLDPAGELVCLTVYRRGAREVLRRLTLAS